MQSYWLALQFVLSKKKQTQPDFYRTCSMPQASHRIRQTLKDNKGKEYEPGTLQTLIPQWFMYKGTFWSWSMSTGSRQLQPRKFFSH